MYKRITFDDVKGVVVCGDIHGDFNALVNKCCVQYGITDSLIIVAGDCGFGFERPGHYENIYQRNKDRLSQANNYMVFVRGNHENPAYFENSVISHKRFQTVPDCSVLSACAHNILCIGGAISIDRSDRMASRHDNQFATDPLARNIYWKDEAPSYDETLLSEAVSGLEIDTVVTHTAPSFCELLTKNGLQGYAEDDTTLIEDVENERKTMDCIHHYLVSNHHLLRHWFYGHFHQSWHSTIGDCTFNMLDIMELRELR